MIGQIVMHGPGREVDASQTLAIEEYVFRFESAGEIGFGNDPLCAIPIQRAGCATRFFYSVAVGIVNVSNASGALNAVFGVIDILAGSRVIGEISGSVVTESRRLIVNTACMLKIAALRLATHGRDHEIPPWINVVVLAPGERTAGCCRRSGRDAVQRVIGKGLRTAGVLIVDNGNHVAVVLVQRSVIVALVYEERGCLTVIGVKAADLKTRVQIIAKIDTRHVALIFCAAGIVRRAGYILRAISVVGRDDPPRRVGSIGDSSPAGIMQRLQRAIKIVVVADGFGDAGEDARLARKPPEHVITVAGGSCLICDSREFALGVGAGVVGVSNSGIREPGISGEALLRSVGRCAIALGDRPMQLVIAVADG